MSIFGDGFSPQGLRAAVDQAISDANAELEEKRRLLAQKKEAETQANKAAARSILMGIPAAAAKAAAEGKSSVAVYRLTINDYRGATIIPDSVASFVAQGLRECGFDPKVQRTIDDGGKAYWDDIYIHW